MPEPSYGTPYLPAGTPFASEHGMETTYEQNNLMARVRALEAHRWEMDRRLTDAHESWKHGNTKITEGIQETHKLVYNPKDGLLVEVDRIKTKQAAQTRFTWWLIGVLTSGSLLILGGLLAKWGLGK